MENMHENHSHHDHHEMMMNMDMDMGMKMYFHTEVGGDKILFKNWQPMSTEGMIVACLITIVVAISYEALKYFREIVRSWQSKETHGTFQAYLMSKLHLLQTVLHAMQYLVSYCLMLIAMTFQLYLFFSIIVGAAIGYLVFTPLTAKIRAEYTSFSEPCC